MFDEEAVRRKFAEASDEELYDILAHPDGYLPAALEAARDALRSRNINPATAAALEASACQKKATEDASAAVRAELPLQWSLRALTFLCSIGLPQLILAEAYLRPRGYVRRARECWLWAGYGLAFVLLASLGLVFITGRYKAYWARSVTNSCIEGVLRTGMPEAEVRRRCACVAQYLADHHTARELTRYWANTRSPKAQEAASEALDACPAQPE